MVEAARSGHPGLPLGAATIAHAIWSRHLRHAPHDPRWPDRDRFVLSAGHGSALLYALLHLHGYDLPLSELRAFRQWGSKTPGHPEVHLTPGVETTTGPLGQGFGNAVGMALAERFRAERYDVDPHRVVDHRTYAIVSDGDLMEGVASEAASLAGTFGLGKLIAVYDDNGISIDGSTDVTFREDVGARFSAYGWHVQHVDGHDLDAVDRALTAAEAEGGRPSIVVARTVIGKDSPLEGTAAVHGAALGPERTRQLKEKLGWPVDEPFRVPPEVREALGRSVERGRALVAAWQQRVDGLAAARPDLADEMRRADTGALPRGAFEDMPSWPPGQKLATRKASGAFLRAAFAHVPELVGGSADLAGSNDTTVKGAGFLGADPGGRNVHFGVREHAMAAIANGMALHGGVRPFVATFLVFTDYMRPAIRLAALSRLPVAYVMTHDSIGLGEDGPTHQPVEHLASLRAIPGLKVFRPADANETREAWMAALERTDGPTLLALTRQDLPVLERPAAADARRGGYVLREAKGGAPDVILIATGSEVAIALEAAEILERGGGPAARVVSLPCWEAFEAQPAEYRETVLPGAVRARVAMEAGVTLGWRRWVGDRGAVIGLDRFGASAPYEVLYRELGLTAHAMAARAREVLAALR